MAQLDSELEILSFSLAFFLSNVLYIIWSKS